MDSWVTKVCNRGDCSSCSISYQQLILVSFNLDGEVNINQVVLVISTKMLAIKVIDQKALTLVIF